MYGEATSSVTSRAPEGSGGILLSLFINFVVYWMYDGREVVQGCRKQSTKCDTFSIRAPFQDTIGLRG